MLGTGILDLVSVNDRLYAHTGGEIVQSIDGGESWKSVPVDANKFSHQPVKAEQSHRNFSVHSRLTIAGNILYVISPEKDNLRVLRLSADGDALIPVQGKQMFHPLSCWQMVNILNKFTYLEVMKETITC